MTEQDTAEVLRRLKAGIDVETIVQYVRDGNLLMQLSLTPETTRRYEFPYTAQMPIHTSIVNNPYMDSLLYQSLFPPSSSRSDASGKDGRAVSNRQNDRLCREQYTQEDARQRATQASKHHSAYMLPYHIAQMVEPIIDTITAAPWTQITTDDRLFRRLIRAYFCYPHPCGPFVHKDLFLEDMAAGRTSFCSPLLVNAMLANASVRIHYHMERTPGLNIL